MVEQTLWLITFITAEKKKKFWSWSFYDKIPYELGVLKVEVNDMADDFMGCRSSVLMSLWQKYWINNAMQVNFQYNNPNDFTNKANTTT